MYTWTTADECAFLRDLGRHALYRIPRLTLLQRYRESLDDRADWGEMNRPQVTAYVDLLLTEYAATA